MSKYDRDIGARRSRYERDISSGRNDDYDINSNSNRRRYEREPQRRKKQKKHVPVLPIFLMVFLCAAMVFLGLSMNKSREKVSELDKQFTSMQNFVDNSPSIIENLQKEITDLKKQQTDLTNKQSQNETSIKSEKARIDELNTLIEKRQKTLNRLLAGN